MSTKKQEQDAERNSETVNAVDQMKKLLDEQIKKYETLKEKISIRDKFISTQTRLNGFSESLEKEKSNGNHETDIFYIKFCSKNGYRDEEAISINNVEVIGEFLSTLGGKISDRINTIEKEIVM